MRLAAVAGTILGLSVTSLIGAESMPPVESMFGEITTSFGYEIDDTEVAFDLITTNIGYQGTIAKEIHGYIELEMSEDLGKRPPFLYQAWLSIGDFLPSVSLSAGLIPTLGWREAADFYGYSYYVFPSTIDLLKNSRTDLGALFSYDFMESGEFNLGIYSGRGYEQLKAPSTGDELTIAFEAAMDIEILTVNLFGDITPNNGIKSKDIELTGGVFGGLNVAKYRGGLEYAYRMNNEGDDSDAAQIQTFSVFGVIPIIPLQKFLDFELFARMDLETRSADDLGQLRVTCGGQYQFSEEIKIALKYDNTSFEKSREENDMHTISVVTDLVF
ncbi:MAG: hypothetical protein OCD01_03605 [Fibrobacterales bacterium]